MKKNLEVESSLICNLKALDTEQRNRHQSISEQLRKTAQEVKELSDGYAFCYPPDSATVLLAAEFITLEWLCCPFLNFTLKVEQEGGPLWLQLTGQEGVKQFLQAELGLEGFEGFE